MQALYQLSYAPVPRPAWEERWYQDVFPNHGSGRFVDLGAMDTSNERPKFRYTAELANEIEHRWQDRW